MTNAEALRWAAQELARTTMPTKEQCPEYSEMIAKLEDLHQRFKDYEDLAKLFEQAKDRLVEA